MLSYVLSYDKVVRTQTKTRCNESSIRMQCSGIRTISYQHGDIGMREFAMKQQNQLFAEKFSCTPESSNVSLAVSANGSESTSIMGVIE